MTNPSSLSNNTNLLHGPYRYLFILLGVLQTSLICGLVSTINFGKFSPIIMYLFYCLFFLLLPVFTLHVCYTSCNYPTVLGYSVPSFQLFFLIFFYPLHFSFGSFYGHIFKITDFPLGHFQTTNEPIEGILHVYYGAFAF